MKTIRFEEPDRPPHFEQIFDLYDEAFGMSMPTEKEMLQATGAERKKLFGRCADVYAKIIEAYRWDALLIWNPVMDTDLLCEFIPFIKRRLGDDIPLGSYVWWAVICIDTVKDYMQFSIDLYEDPKKLHAWAEQLVTAAMQRARRLADAGSDLVEVGSDMAYNAGPFISPEHFAEFVTPYLTRILTDVKKSGPVAILHSDGNLTPVLDQILAAGPQVLQSIDPMAGMDIAEVKRRSYGKMALMGNVQCNLLQDGPDEAIIRSATYCLDHGSPGGGFIYSSSNTIFKGLPLRNYELMLKVFHERFGVQ